MIAIAPTHVVQEMASEIMRLVRDGSTVADAVDVVRRSYRISPEDAAKCARVETVNALEGNS